MLRLEPIEIGDVVVRKKGYKVDDVPFWRMTTSSQPLHTARTTPSSQVLHSLSISELCEFQDTSFTPSTLQSTF